MKLIIGLGNLGPEYVNTRHNIAWQVFDELPLDWRKQAKFHAMTAELGLQDKKVIFVKPTTFYNETGQAVRALKDFYKISNQDILIVHDELALPFGVVRTRQGGSDAGNNGIKSVNAHVGQDTARVRIGISHKQRDYTNDADFVLHTFSESERSQLSKIKATAKDCIDAFIKGSFDHTTHAHSS